MKIFHTFILFAIFNLSAFSQHEFLARVNPSDLSFTTFDSIPGVAWISVNTGTMDENNHRFFFIGAPPNFTPSRLYTLDALTGSIIYNPLIPSNFSSSSYLGGLEYDNNSDTLYGLFQDGTTLNWYLAWIDYTNGFVHPKYNQQATTFGIGSTTYDKNHHRYLYSMGSTQYVLEAHTGQVIYSYTLPYYYYDLKYNNSNDKLYCISNPVNPLNFEFDTVEIATGILHAISNMPFHYVVGTPMLKAIDETNGRYFCVAGLTNTSWQLYTINIQNGSIMYSPFDTLLGNQHNLIELHYYNVLDTLYALYWGQSIALAIPEINNELSSVSMNPNPSSGFITLVHNGTTKLEIEIHNIVGELIYKSTSQNQQITIDLTLKPKGIYFVKVFDGEKSYCKKLIVE